MEEQEIKLLDDTINRESSDYKELISLMRETTALVDKAICYTAPSLFNERYLTTKEIMKLFRISRRALQNYRDAGIMPYIAIGRVILYPESMVKKAFEKNYYKPTVGKNPI